jgi:starch phosphorylase
VTDIAQTLRSLASNLSWCWSRDGASLFRALDPERWEQVHHDPHALLAALDDDTIAAGVARSGLEDRIGELANAQDAAVMSDEAALRVGALRARPVAYFSMEFGLHESLAIYSGGLGVLAGDHLKSASDLGLPLVALGFFYREGYFEQRVDGDGWQQEAYPRVEPEAKGLRRATDADGQPVKVSVESEKGVIHAAVWELNVGRVRLFLLDSDVAENEDGDRALTARLYGGDSRQRIRQELLLGVGGVRALKALGIQPGVMHLNEGHCAFAGLEAIAQKMEGEGASFEEAKDEVASQTVFTTHTPVPAGHDRFDQALALEHLRPLGKRLWLDDEALMALGSEAVAVEGKGDVAFRGEPSFCMTVLALRLAQSVNGVSFLHGRVSRQMWQQLYPETPLHRVPIGHITNGVHVPSWMAPRSRRFLDGVLGADWEQTQADPETWAPLASASDEDLWGLRTGLKEGLLRFVRARAAREAKERGESADVVSALAEALDPQHLVVGFARRFATYKRATLLFQDLDVLDQIVNDPDKPMRFVFAGKAHPRDEGGKKLIQRIHGISRDPRFLGKVILLGGYDIAVGRALTAGVDVWLNNPRRPLEASGTSGQKVVLNAGLNCSILDGWWAEGFDGTNGFAIGDGEVHRDHSLQDAKDGEALLSVLRGEVAPLYYERTGGLPVGWIERVRRSMVTLGWRFNSDRMVLDYARSAYLPAAGVQLAEAR